jgi:hypothetical protein
MLKKKILLSLLAPCFQLAAYDTAYQAAQEFKKIVSHGKKDAGTKQQAAQIIQDSWNKFFVTDAGIVTGMINHYYTVFGEAPHVEIDQENSDQCKVALEQSYACACEDIKRLQKEVQDLELKFIQEKNLNEKLSREQPPASATAHKVPAEGVSALSNTFVYDTAHQAAQEFKRMLSYGKRDAVTQQQAAHIIQNSLNKFFIKDSGIVTGMINHYYTVFGESPFAIDNQQNVDQRNVALEQSYARACEDIKRLQKEAQELELKFIQEKNLNEKLYQELVALSVTAPQAPADDASITLVQLYEKLKEAFKQYEVEFGSHDDQKNLVKEKMFDAFKPIEQREAELHGMLEQWNEIMNKLRDLSQKAEFYENTKLAYEQRGAELKRITEQRDMLERQLRDLHRKFDSEQAKSTIVLNDAHSQLEATRNQLAEMKNQLALAKKQQNAAPKNQEIEKQLQAERAAYEGALSDERMQRQKLRQQVQELQKRLEVERASYEKRITSLEQEVVMLIERLPAGQRTVSLPIRTEVSEPKEEKRRI